MPYIFSKILTLLYMQTVYAKNKRNCVYDCIPHGPTPLITRVYKPLTVWVQKFHKPEQNIVKNEKKQCLHTVYSAMDRPAYVGAKYEHLGNLHHFGTQKDGKHMMKMS